ncbi:MAG: sulfurtransferase-like selenium metabolism protein YedF [Firmicutes bacterium]|nr:sulfurtransferase-like selenium metabolism protein YedF [Bacillota bacterium]
MKKEILDCRGMSCPQPVVETKKRLSALSAGSLDVLVDNETAKNNILKLAASLNISSAVKEEAGIYTISLLKEEDSISVSGAPDKKILLVTSDRLGHGSDELGVILMKSFFYALTESRKLPKAIYFINSAVKLTCAQSPVLDSLQKLTARGVELYSCGLCLDFFQLKDKLQIGEITNMYDIVEQITGNLVTKI